MRLWLMMLALAVMSLGVTACGGDDDADDVVDPEPATEMQDDGMDGTDEMAASDIVDTAVAAGSFTTLAAALEAANLIDTLKGEGPFTVFAPTDDAFNALPDGTLDDLLLEENVEQLTSILTYHVVSGSVLSGELTDGQEVTTLQGETLLVSIDEDGTVKIGDATVIDADIEASNGVIHVIDTVLLPSGE